MRFLIVTLFLIAACSTVNQSRSVGEHEFDRLKKQSREAPEENVFSDYQKFIQHLLEKDGDSTVGKIFPEVLSDNTEADSLKCLPIILLGLENEKTCFIGNHQVGDQIVVAIYQQENKKLYRWLSAVSHYGHHYGEVSKVSIPPAPQNRGHSRGTFLSVEYDAGGGTGVGHHKVSWYRWSGHQLQLVVDMTKESWYQGTPYLSNCHFLSTPSIPIAMTNHDRGGSS